ncbi:hypothetical protein BDV27DRAFT_127518 [Aspergillus caelatus]|uniref:N-acetylgalactosaminide beta-1,3-galactosyltransferase n=2 Tax=Aspergillus subgen. Circumdati TaxID=2720871 RepID=A0A5N7A7A2_9EURO|nr:uncharacterized protein BDV27DRAFT_127518 [Aspergillus caelatus]KAE8364999.1 hypothetical protein BDV27DRAFT_127518 [Aspergillus caelatus]KAE8411027.1 hypothetical protein BDV36DRAFT_275993 [Aspergillus pseudocaelatus]
MKIWRQCVSRPMRVLLYLVALVLLLCIVLPYDHPIRLSARFNVKAFGAAFTSYLGGRWWFSERSTFPVVLSDDVAVLMKSGFGTKDRIAAWLEAHEQDRFNNLLLVGDFATPSGQLFSYNGRRLPVFDLVAWMLEKGYLSAELAHPRLMKHSNLSAAISNGDTEIAKELSKSFGWELDALKFISGLELCYNQMPDKKWYIMADDDTYLMQPALKLLLEHLDSEVPFYVGNAVGDYKGRFAHGGSSVVLSQATMRLLFSRHDVVTSAHLESLEETWGDKLLATTLLKLGIYLDERYVVFFNGGPPRAIRVTEDRLCAPIISFHSLTPSEMINVGRRFQHTDEVLLWIDLWDIYGAPSLDSPILESGRKNWDHVGGLDESTMTVNDVPTAQKCIQICHNYAKSCLAWTWESEKQLCHISNWMVPGEQAEGKTSGINVPRAKSLVNMCRP